MGGGDMSDTKEGRERGKTTTKEAHAPSGTSAPVGIHLCRLQMLMGTMRTPACKRVLGGGLREKWIDGWCPEVDGYTAPQPNGRRD